MIPIKPLILSFLATIMINGCAYAYEQELTRIKYTDAQIADAIYIAEGGAKTRHPYGVLAHYKHTTPRQACLNTIRHQYRIWIVKTGGKGDFIAYLGHIYAPINSNTDNGTNKYWVNNVKRILAKG